MKLKLKVHPRASRQKILQKSATEYELWVNAPPDKGRANEAVLEAMSEKLGVPKSRLSIVSGLTSKNKTLEL